MTKEAFIKYLARTNRRSQAHYQTAIHEILTGIREQLIEGKTVPFIGFGTFHTTEQKAYKGHDPKTGKPLTIPAMRLVRFRPSELLKQAVKQKHSASEKPKPQRREKLLGFLGKK